MHQKETERPQESPPPYTKRVRATAKVVLPNETLQAKVAAFIEEHRLLPERGRVVVAVSGGADSLCLLHILYTLCGPGRSYPQVYLHVAHLDHQLRPEVSAHEAEQVAQLATTWGLPVTVGRTNVPALAREERLSLEEAARVARYRFLRSVAQGDNIAVAHHQDDQVETLLLHWLRGGGITSMIGLQPRQHDIIRPLLCATRAETLAYCQQQQLAPIEDTSNRDPRFLRNRIRHELLPLLTSMNSNIRATLLRNAEVLSVDAAWIEEQVSACWSTVVAREEADGVEIKRDALLALPLSLQRHLLRRCAEQLCAGQSPLELRHYHLLEHFLQKEQQGETRTLHLPAGLRAIYRRGTLTLKVRATHSSHHPATDEVHAGATAPETVLSLSSLPTQVEVAGLPWYARAECLPQDILDAVRAALVAERWQDVWQLLPVSRYVVYIDADMVPEMLYIRPRRPGDRIRPLGMAVEKKVKEVLIDAHVPREERELLPLFLARARPDAQEQGVWLAGVCLDDRVRLTKQTRRIVRLMLLPGEQEQLEKAEAGVE
jgi:tRNA(Ile)-lysidine synthase